MSCYTQVGQGDWLRFGMHRIVREIWRRKNGATFSNSCPCLLFLSFSFIHSFKNPTQQDSHEQNMKYQIGQEFLSAKANEWLQAKLLTRGQHIPRYLPFSHFPLVPFRPIPSVLDPFLPCPSVQPPILNTHRRSGDTVSSPNSGFRGRAPTAKAILAYMGPRKGICSFWWQGFRI